MLSSSFSSSTFSGKKIRCVVTVVVVVVIVVVVVVVVVTVVVVVVIVVVDTEMPNREQIQIKSRNFSSTQKVSIWRLLKAFERRETIINHLLRGFFRRRPLQKGDKWSDLIFRKTTFNGANFFLMEKVESLPSNLVPLKLQSTD